MNGLAQLAERFDTTVGAFCGELDILVHGTTTADNTMIEMNGAPTGLLVTEGHRDEIEMRRVHKEEIWDPSYPAPAPIARRRARIPIPERMNYRGRGAPRARRGRGPPRRPPAAGPRGPLDRGHVPVLVREPGPRAPRRRDRLRGVPRRRARVAVPRGDGAGPRVRAGLDDPGQRLRRPPHRELRREPPDQAARGRLRRVAAHHAGHRRGHAARVRVPAGGVAAGVRPDRRGDGRDARRPQRRRARLRRGRHGRHELRRVPGPRRSARDQDRLELAVPLLPRTADGGRAERRRGGRLRRPGPPGGAAGRARERRVVTRAGLLRAGRGTSRRSPTPTRCSATCPRPGSRAGG